MQSSKFVEERKADWERLRSAIVKIKRFAIEPMFEEDAVARVDRATERGTVDRQQERVGLIATLDREQRRSGRGHGL